MKKIILISLFSLLSACVTSNQNRSSSVPPQQVSERVISAVTLCSPGSSVSISAETTLINELTKILEKQGSAKASTKIKNTIRQIAFGDQRVTNSISIESQSLYSQCVLDNLNQL